MNSSNTHSTPADSQSAATGARVSLWGKFAVTVFVIGLHANPFEAHQPIPYVLSLIAATSLLVKHARKIPMTEARCMLGFLGVALLCSLVAPRPEFLLARLKSFTYLSFSVIAGFAVFLELKTWPRKYMAKYFGSIAILLLIGAAAEIFVEPLHRLSNSFRYWNFRFPYSNDERDIMYHGGIRPNLFGAEPSYLSKNFCFALIGWLLLSQRRRRLAVFMFATAIGMYLMRSPELVLLPGAAAAYLLFGPAGGIFARMKPGARVLLGGTSATFIACISTVVLWDTIGGRIEHMLLGDDASTAVRLWASFSVVPKLLAFNPLSGIGVGGTEAFASDVIAQQFSQVGQWLIDTKSGEGMTENLIQNFLASYVVALGLVGGALGVVMLARFVRLVAQRSGLFWVLFLAFALTYGAFNGLPVWSVFFVLAAVVRAVPFSLVDSRKTSRTF